METAYCCCLQGRWAALAPVHFTTRGGAHHRAPSLITIAMMRPKAGDVRGGNQLFVFGTGFVGRYISGRLIRQGWHVSGTCTSDSKKKELEELGLEAFIFDAATDKLINLPTLQNATHLLISVPPLASIGDPLLYLHEDLRATIGEGSLEWLGYLSTTSMQASEHVVIAGVYGDCLGAWVDEEHPANPTTESAKLRLAAESGWLDLGHELGVSANVFRLGGIYGPGRSALDTITKGKSLSEVHKKRESKQFTARVHVADIYQAVKASFDVRSPRGLYNVVDDHPAPREEVFAFAYNLIEERWPGLLGKSDDDDKQDKKPPNRHMVSEKRVSNARLKKELGVNLAYPDYRLGLQNILESMQKPKP